MMSDVLNTISRSPGSAFTYISIVAIIMGGIIIITRMKFKHLERMEMINQGIDPDYPPEEADKNDDLVKS